MEYNARIISMRPDVHTETYFISLVLNEQKLRNRKKYIMQYQLWYLKVQADMVISLLGI